MGRRPCCKNLFRSGDIFFLKNNDPADLFVTGALVDGGTVTVGAAAGALSVVAGSPFAVAA